MLIVTKKENQRGMSLIEVMITLFVVSVLLALYAASMNVVALTKRLEKENLAYHIANKKMEELRGVAYASLSGSGTITDSMLAQLPLGSGSYAVIDHSGFNGLKEITVTVTWNDGASRQVQLKTLAGSGGINP